MHPIYASQWCRVGGSWKGKVKVGEGSGDGGLGVARVEVGRWGSFLGCWLAVGWEIGTFLTSTVSDEINAQRLWGSGI